ncbi:6-pyruvoyl tetrahydropterin synthase [Bdellovibrio bacteriovorus]|uniref:6-carboxy-5,6,7,8-tetrahydropterin synthase n=1 Tax=Bdellovibrio bacteriovorus TaxID=959 RepID=A0A150WJM4_BDEBC|nr:6-carboxytetrahydropterin synthase [Bdellovibrio bacteriovorus]KYG63959.1 6-pyruvoyl tetrahydropterin synthase [Bdellovibrio bacteriovorus]
MMLTLSVPFSSAHLYHQPQWSDEKNRQVFGRCFTKHGHGHNYVLETKFYVTSASCLDDETRYRKILNQLVAVLDHEHLNFVIPEFKEKIPTTENIALYFLEKLKSEVPLEVLHSVKLYETETLWTEILL